MGIREAFAKSPDIPREKSVEVCGETVTVRAPKIRAALNAFAKIEGGGEDGMDELVAVCLATDEDVIDMPLAELVTKISGLPITDRMALYSAAMLVTGYNAGNSLRASGSNSDSVSPSESSIPIESATA